MASDVTLDHLETTRATTDVVNRFIDAFQKKDASAIPDLVADVASWKRCSLRRMGSG
jgi:hypothetical protein